MKPHANDSRIRPRVLGRAADSLTAVVAIGESSDELRAAFAGSDVRAAGSIEEAVRMAMELAKK